MNEFAAEYPTAEVEVVMAYIRPVSNGATIAYAVCAADGTQLALFDSEEAAYYTARQHDLEPLRVH